MRKNLHWLLLTTVLMLSIAMAGVGTASPAFPVIRVEPKNNTGDVGENFTVNITVTDVSISTLCNGLYGWECRITFKPGIINAVNATEGPFLRDTGYETFWRMKIDNTTGTIDMLAIISEFPFPPTGAVGSGTLATVTFKVVGQGATKLDFKEKKDTELHTVLFGTGGVGTETPMEHTAEDGSFSNAGPPIPLHLIAGIVVVVAVCTVALFYFRRKRAATET